jgi:urea transport system substrate-binding protein
MPINRRAFLQTGIGGAATLAASPLLTRAALAADTIDVGVLFSLTGGLSIIEKSLHDATLMAISEINASGGVMGKQVNAIVEDGASDPKTYNE